MLLLYPIVCRGLLISVTDVQRIYTVRVISKINRLYKVFFNICITLSIGLYLTSVDIT